jgi:hypothetical protein
MCMAMVANWRGAEATCRGRPPRETLEKVEEESLRPRPPLPPPGVALFELHHWDTTDPQTVVLANRAEGLQLSIWRICLAVLRPAQQILPDPCRRSNVALLK